MAPLAEFVPVPCGYSSADSFAAVFFVIVAAVGAAPDYLVTAYDNRARFDAIIQRMFSRPRFCGLYVFVVGRDVLNAAAGRQIRVGNRHCDNVARRYNELPMTKFDKLYRDILERILKEGVREKNARTGHETIALPGVHFSIDIEHDGFPLLTLRKIPVKMFVAEQIWFVSGSRKPADFLRDFTKIWDSFTNPADTVTVAYGYRWRKHFGRDQLGLLIKLLKKEPSSRHGVIVTWDPAEDGLGGTKRANVPCPYSFTVNIIGGRLHLHNVIRSNDMFLGFPSDVAGFALLQCILAQKLGVKTGVYSHSISNAHVYDNQEEAVKELLQRTNNHKPIRLALPKNTFERAEKKDKKLVDDIVAPLAAQYEPLAPISMQIVL